MHRYFVAFSFRHDVLGWIPGSVFVDLAYAIDSNGAMLQARDHVAAIFKHEPRSVVLTGFQQVYKDGGEELILCPFCDQLVLTHVCDAKGA